MLVILKIEFMETLMVLPRDAEQKRAIEAFLKALKIKYVRQK